MMDASSKKVLATIPLGRMSAVSSVEITRRTGIAERDIQHAIQKLRVDGHPIAAAITKPFGYYIPRNQEEAIEWEKQLSARIKSQCIALNCARRALEKPPIGFQESLFEGGKL